MRLLYVIPLLGIGLISLLDAPAQEPAPDTADAKLRAQANLILRESPPSAWFYIKGDKIGVINKGDKVIAKDERVIGTLFGKYRWLKVEKIDAQTGERAGIGWVYAGDPTVSYFAAIDAGIVPRESAPRAPDVPKPAPDEKGMLPDSSREPRGQK